MLREKYSKEQVVKDSVSEASHKVMELVTACMLFGLGCNASFLSPLGTEIRIHITDDPDTSSYEVIPAECSGMEHKTFEAMDVDGFCAYLGESEGWGYDHEDLVAPEVLKREMEIARRKEMEV